VKAVLSATVVGPFRVIAPLPVANVVAPACITLPLMVICPVPVVSVPDPVDTSVRSLPSAIVTSPPMLCAPVAVAKVAGVPEPWSFCVTSPYMVVATDAPLALPPMFTAP
jgi:hypothetical protein